MSLVEAELTTLVGNDIPLRLHDAVKIAFPRGGMSVSGLRREAKRGRLIIERVAGKDFTTLNHIERMRELCRVEQVHRDCGNDQSAATKPGRSPMLPPGSSLMEVANSALASRLMTLMEPTRRSQRI